MYSERLSGSGEMALKISSGGPPRQIATGIRSSSPSPLAFPSLWWWASAWSAPCLCICQWSPHSVGPYTWARYIPRFCSPVAASLVTTNGRVIVFPASSGQVLGIGSFVRSGFSTTTSWQAAFLTRFGAILRACLASGIPFQGLPAIAATSGFIRPTSRLPISEYSSTPRAIFTRSGVPNKFIASGISEMLPSGNLGCSNSNALPPILTTRSAMQPASNSMSTGREIRNNSPDSSSESRNCLRLLQPTSRTRGSPMKLRGRRPMGVTDSLMRRIPPLMESWARRSPAATCS